MIDVAGPPPYAAPVRNCLSLLLALLIILVFGGTGLFLWYTSTQAKFERKDKASSPVLVKPAE